MSIVIIGNSAAGLSALETFRKYDKKTKITLISKEGDVAYSRVLLPYVLRGKLKYNNLFIRDKEYYEKNNVDYIEKEVKNIDTEAKVVILSDDTKVEYSKLLIATGSNAVKPPIPGINEDGIYNMWTKSDVDNLAPLFDSKKKVAVIGSGFVALQAAWAAVVRGLEVTVIELADRVMPSVLDEKGAEILTEKIRKSGVDLKTSTLTQNIEKLEDGTFKISLKDQDPVHVDFIIVGTGVRPNTQFLSETGITIDRGILVDRFMETNVKDVYSAGDVAQGPTAFGEEHVIHALWPTAIEMGKIAGANMAGKALEYEGSLNMNVTQMYGTTVASMGKFSEKDVQDAYYFDESDGYGYLKVCYEKDLLVGACLVGSTDAVKLFGKLRPIIRKKIKADVAPEKLENFIEIEAFLERI
ncbi:FAD-dependent oxidoreductase [Clostridioides difficile]